MTTARVNDGTGRPCCHPSARPRSPRPRGDAMVSERSPRVRAASATLVAVLLRVVHRDEDTPALRDALWSLYVDAFEGDVGIDDAEHAEGGVRVIAFEGAAPVAHAAVVARRLEVDGRPFHTGY